MDKAACKGSLFWGVLLTVLVLGIFAMRLTGPSDLEGDAQSRNVGYVMDAVMQGHWLVQTDVHGWIMSKPPLHTWLASAFALAGGINRMTLALPSVFAVLGMTLLVCRVGRQRFGALAGGFAGLAVVMAPIMSKHIALVRTDALFTLAIACGAVAAHRAWERGGGWMPFWLAAAVATLIKGPLGLVLAAMGLLALFWERRTDPAAPGPRGSHPKGTSFGAHRAGIGLYLALTLGWLLLAIHAYGKPLVDKMFFEELLGHATGVGRGGFPARNFPKPTIFFVIRFLPFSLFAAYGLWRVVRHPAADAAVRRFERFLFCWIAGGLLLFSLASHHRGDLLLPLWPAAALLAGREMARLGERIGARWMAAGTAAVCVVLLGALYKTYHASPQKRSKEVQYTVAAEAAGRALAAGGLEIGRLHHLDTPVTLQLQLGTFRTWIGVEEALRLAWGTTPVLLAVHAPEDFPALFGPNGPPLQEVFRWPPGEGGRAVLLVFGNAGQGGTGEAPPEGRRAP